MSSSSSRYSLRQTPRKKELFEGMVETPSNTRKSTSRRRQTPPQIQGSDPEKDSFLASTSTSISTSTSDMSTTDNRDPSPAPAPAPRRRTAKFTESLDEDDLDVKPVLGLNGNTNGQANGNGITNGIVNGNGIANGHKPANGSSAPSGEDSKDSKDSRTSKDNKDKKEHGAFDGWRPGQDPKIDSSGEFEFGGSWGSGSMMILFPILMWYMWVGATYYDGNFPSRSPGQSWPDFASHLAGLVYTGAFPHARAWLWYWSYLIVEGAFYCLLPGVWSYGKPLPHEGGRQLRYFCNAYVSLYTTLAALAGLHFSGAWPLQNAIDHFGPLLSVAIISGFLVSIVAYVSAIWRGKQHRMTGSLVYDFFMGAELNPRMFGILDFKMFFEVRMPWYILLILSLGAAARQHEQYGYVSAEVWFLVMAHFLYANACAKGEELIVATWDMFYEKWGFMLIFWNLAGVPLSYCHCTIYLANNDPATYRWNRVALAVFYAAYLFWYWVWDSCNSQKNRFRAAEKGQVVWRNTFPQVPWQTVKNPQTIQTPQGTILVDGWYGLARKIHYTADTWFAISWALITGFNSPFPWFYPVFFVCMISHRAARDIHRCRQKYGDAWLEYERRVPYLFIPYVF